MPGRRGRRCWTERSICPGAGRTIQCIGQRWVWPPTRPLPPSPNGCGRCGRGPGTSRRIRLRQMQSPSWVGWGPRGPAYTMVNRARAAPEGQPWGRYLRFRRSQGEVNPIQAYLVYADQPCDREILVPVVGTRGCIESGCEAAKGEVGLDEYEVCSATGGYRHMTLALWALVLWAVIRTPTLLTVAPAKKPTGRLAACQRSCGRGSGCAWRRSASSCGRYVCGSSPPPALPWLGRTVSGPTRGGPRTAIISGARKRLLYNCNTNGGGVPCT